MLYFWKKLLTVLHLALVPSSAFALIFVVLVLHVDAFIPDVSVLLVPLRPLSSPASGYDLCRGS